MEESQEKKMSKYALKCAKRRACAKETERAFAAIECEEQRKEEPNPAAPPPPLPRSHLNDLGTRPQKLSSVLAEVVMKMREAERIAKEIKSLANRGIQSSEPLAIAQFVMATRQRLEGMMERAAHIPNAPQSKEV